MAVAQHGLTRGQADIVMGHMMNINTLSQLIISKTGLTQENSHRDNPPMDTREFIFRGHH